MGITEQWIGVTAETLAVERRQAIDEGKDFEQLEDEFERLVEAVESDPAACSDRGREFLDASVELPIRDNYEYREPSSLEGIRDARSGPDSWSVDLTADERADRCLGAWRGRTAGCLLGKPVETWNRDRITGFLRAADAYPLRSYVRSDVPSEVAEEYDLDAIGEYQRAFVNEVDHIPRDDDIDYTILALSLLREHGESFESGDVAAAWLSHLPAYRTYTAERVAYRNFLQLVEPPASATRRNPYREGIGALIRGDCYGYVNVGAPARAAEFAWRDARISHVKNGIYGSMWVAAMLAVAPLAADPERTIRSGLSVVPSESRLVDAVTDVLEWYRNGTDYETAVDRIHSRWDESETYSWLHTVTNAQVIATGLLWGDDTFEVAVGRTVQAGFDTDSNGATVGSVMGMRVGASELSDRWTAPLSDTVETGLVGRHRETLASLADRTIAVATD